MKARLERKTGELHHVYLRLEEAKGLRNETQVFRPMTDL